MRAASFRSLLVVGCWVLGSGACVDPHAREGGGGPRDRSEVVPLSVCDDGAPPSAVAHGFRHARSSWIAAWSAAHVADDAIAVAGEGGRVRAKFAYGSVSKDLEDEWIEVRVDDCGGGTRRLGFARTDSDGRIDMELVPSELSALGRHRLTLRVWGDATTIAVDLYVVPVGTKVAVFDIDGTLTTSDLELFADVVTDFFEPIAAGDWTPAARAGASELTARRATQGYLPIYLTGRPYWLGDRTRDWLHDVGVAAGPLTLAPTNSDAWPFDSGVGEFKAGVLAELQLRGLQIEVAYGNATTDVFAYAEAGVSPDHVFVAGRHGGADGTVAVGDDWRAHLDGLDPAVVAVPTLAWP